MKKYFFAILFFITANCFGQTSIKRVMNDLVMVRTYDKEVMLHIIQGMECKLLKYYVWYKGGQKKFKAELYFSQRDRKEVETFLKEHFIELVDKK